MKNSLVANIGDIVEQHLQSIGMLKSPDDISSENNSCDTDV